jgi:4-azaleucine resistance transporter AzlC
MSGLASDPSFRSGLRAGVPVAVAGLALAISFGVVARPVLGEAGTIVMSAIVFAGSAQFGSVAVLAAGGGPVAAITAGILLNSRYVPMGVALAPSLGEKPRLRRALIGQAMVDYSWAAAMRGGGRFDHRFMIGATLPMYVSWVAGAAIGALAGEAIGDPERLGLDAIFPAFFLALLLGGEAGSSPRALAAALLGGAIALVLIPLVPPGIPVIAACLAALIGLERGRRSDTTEPERSA